MTTTDKVHKGLGTILASAHPGCEAFVYLESRDEITTGFLNDPYEQRVPLAQSHLERLGNDEIVLSFQGYWRLIFHGGTTFTAFRIEPPAWLSKGSTRFRD